MTGLTAAVAAASKLLGTMKDRGVNSAEWKDTARPVKLTTGMKDSVPLINSLKLMALQV